jgi:hypothetical protein
MTLLQALASGVIAHWPENRPLQVIRFGNGWVLGTFDADGGVLPETYAFPSRSMAEQFLAIALPDLLFIPSALPFH